MIEAEIIRSGAESAIFDTASYSGYDPLWFDQAAFKSNGARLHSVTGRGGVLMLRQAGETWVLRHYHRGGFVAKLVYDHYLWLALERTRPFREWRLLAELHGSGLPAPRPIAARAVRHGLFYRADIVTALIPDVRPLSSYLREGEVAADRWREIGRMLRRFHDHGVDHPDLTAHNILLGPESGAFLVDFDNASLKPAGAWQLGGMARLQRSLRKVALEFGTEFDEAAWSLLLDAYERA